MRGSEGEPESKKKTREALRESSNRIKSHNLSKSRGEEKKADTWETGEKKH